MQTATRHRNDLVKFNEIIEKYEFVRTKLIKENEDLKSRIEEKKITLAELKEGLNAVLLKLEDLKCIKLDKEASFDVLEKKHSSGQSNSLSNNEILSYTSELDKEIECETMLLKSQKEACAQQYLVDFEILKEESLLKMRFIKCDQILYIKLNATNLNAYYDKSTIEGDKRKPFDKLINDFNTRTKNKQNLREFILSLVQSISQ